ncbi:Fic/DOC family N-terminal domain-containing protein [Desulfobacter postgatei]|jgi:Fic family protein|uniref:Fic family protein n=1 Tax=Desulfobacter postgatei TaxID=2293 RepID=UPI002A35F913|nr:Fic/DOC family N-terminal domain-containing protein [Desulfobacter postgatei]MDX9964020.1 Fic/DOC family N-terminal domain-containing protein [Desulfobacter postgatei]
MNPYEPDKLPLTDLDYRRLLPLVGQANAALARYDGLLQGIPNPSVMLSPLTTQEAVLSSKIEGTQATIDEVLEQEAGLIKEGEKFKDIQEISNYRKALFSAREYLKDYPIRLSFVRELHRILLDSVRGQDKTPGEFRKDQNWIGNYGCTIEHASFVPPNPLQLPDFLQEWEHYLDSDDMDFLLQTAVVHAQFELLHPFKDGNGRIGRILIPLFLYQKKVLSQPMFYLSGYLENHREEYYVRLKGISSDHDWNGWIAFFLQAVITQANQNGERVGEILRLYEDMKDQIHKTTHSQYTVHLLDALFNRPIFDSSHLVRHTEIPAASVKSFIPRLKKEGILTELRPASGRQPAILAFGRLLNIAEGKNVF